MSWRGWRDFGTGALGDMGCHIIDHPVWALNLGAPRSVEARTTLDGSVLSDNTPNFETYPIAALIYYEFPGRGDLPPVRMTWYDGGLMPPAPPGMPADDRLPDNGVLYIGTKGVMYHSSHGGMPQLLPRALHEEAAKVPRTIARSAGPLRGMDRRGQRRAEASLQLRLLRPIDRDRSPRRPLPSLARQASGVGQREPQGHERARAERVRARRIPQRMDVVNDTSLPSEPRPLATAAVLLMTAASSVCHDHTEGDTKTL